MSEITDGIFLKMALQTLSSRKRSLVSDEDIELDAWLKSNDFVTMRCKDGVRWSSKSPFTSNSPFKKAIEEGNLKILRLLWERTSIKDPKRYHDLIWNASICGHIECIKWLHDEVGIVEVNNRNSCGYTAIALACVNKHLECCKFLESIGGDLNIADDDGVTPLMRACEGEDCLDVVKWIVKGTHVHYYFLDPTPFLFSSSHHNNISFFFCAFIHFCVLFVKRVLFKTL